MLSDPLRGRRTTQGQTPSVWSGERPRFVARVLARRNKLSVGASRQSLTAPARWSQGQPRPVVAATSHKLCSHEEKSPGKLGKLLGAFSSVHLDHATVTVTELRPCEGIVSDSLEPFSRHRYSQTVKLGNSQESAHSSAPPGRQGLSPACRQIFTSQMPAATPLRH